MRCYQSNKINPILHDMANRKYIKKKPFKNFVFYGKKEMGTYR